MVTIHLESAVVPEPLGRNSSLPPQQGSTDTSPGCGGLHTTRLLPGAVGTTRLAAPHHQHPMLAAVGDGVLAAWTSAWSSAAMLRVLLLMW